MNWTSAHDHWTKVLVKQSTCAMNIEILSVKKSWYFSYYKLPSVLKIVISLKKKCN